MLDERLHNLDWGKVQEQAEKLAYLAVAFHDSNTENPLPRPYINERGLSWIRWLTSESSGRSMKLRDGILHFLDQEYHDEFSDALEACRQSDGTLSMHNLVQFLFPELSVSLSKKIGLEYNPGYSTLTFRESQIGNNLTDYLQERYGVDFSSLDAIDMADLLHAAFIRGFDRVKEAHSVHREIADYLTSSWSQTGNGSDPYNPQAPSLDSIIAFFNSYDEKKAIEEILYDIEKRKISDTLSGATKHLVNNAESYRIAFQFSLDEILQNLRLQLETSKLEGSRNVINRLIDYYQPLVGFSIESVPDNLDGWAFPRGYQAEAILENYRQKRFLIADDMGTGKTAIGGLLPRFIEEQEAKKGNPITVRTLFVTTNTNKYECKNKIQRYLGLSDEDVVVINGKRRHDQYEEAREAPFVIINYELLRAKDWKEKDFLEWELDDDQISFYRLELERAYHRQGQNIDKLEYIIQRIPARYRSKVRASVDNIDDAILAYAKIRDLNDSKSVAHSLDNLNFNHVVVDEIHKGKRKTSLNAKAILQVTESAEYVTLLSGTPFVNGLLDLGIIFEILGIYDEFLEDSRSRLQALIDSAADPKLIKQEERNLSKLEAAVESGDVEYVLLSNPRMIRDYLRPKMHRRKAENVLNMPNLNRYPEGEEIDINQTIRLSYYESMAYQILQMFDFGNSSDQLRALQMFLLDPKLYLNKFRPARNALGEVTGVQPILPKEVVAHLQQTESPKYRELKQFLQGVFEGDSKKKNALIYSSMYRQGVTEPLEMMLASEFPQAKFSHIDGTVIDTERDHARTNIIDDFNKSSTPYVIIALLSVVSEAIELHHRCSNVGHLDNSFTAAQDDQGDYRVYRSDQDQAVNAHNFLIANSVDIAKWTLIQNKRRLGNLLLEGYPLVKEELDILDINEANIERSGFVENYIRRRNEGVLRLMGSLYASGREKIMQTLGIANNQSQSYADIYILSGMSDASLKSIYRDMKRLGRLGEGGQPGGRILDLAAGYGTFSHATGIPTINLEINPIMIERAKEFSPHARYTKALMQDMPYRNGSFEQVICSLAFHYAHDEEKGRMLREIHRVVQDDGYVYFTESLQSVDAAGKKVFREALEHTGFSVVKEGVSRVDDKRFYKVIAQRTHKGQLYNKSFSLRGYIDEEGFDPNDISSIKEDVRKKYAPKAA